MEYYNDLNGEPCNYFEGGFTEREMPLKADGTILPKHKNLHLLVGEGKYYKTTPNAQGKYEADTVKNATESTADNEALITAHATKIIEDAYTPLKQRKLLAELGYIESKIRKNGSTPEYETRVDEILAINEWVASIRNQENVAIANGTPFADITWVV